MWVELLLGTGSSDASLVWACIATAPRKMEDRGTALPRR
jgi:hypothetical protein